MKVFKRKNKNGSYGKHYHFNFVHNEERYYGSTGCTRKRDAEAFVRNIIEPLKQQKSAKQITENFRDTLSQGSNILVSEAFQKSKQKPRSKTVSEKQFQEKEKCWNDFCAFLVDHYADVRILKDVTSSMAEEYMTHLQSTGKYDKAIKYKQGKNTIQYRQNAEMKLSPRAYNMYLGSLKDVFRLLSKDAGLLENPFEGIKRMPKKDERREAFTPSELRKISESGDEFVYALFAIGIYTGFREGDICTLKWDEVDLENRKISKRIEKTDNDVEIPIMPPLYDYLVRLKSEENPDQLESEYTKYALPEHAKLYKESSEGVGYRVRKLLKSLNIETKRKIPRRTRAVSVKDVHSLRHTFIYQASLHGIPTNVVQSVVGHSDPAMTMWYATHVDLEAKREKMGSLPDFMGLTNRSLSRIEEPLSDEAKIELIHQLLKGKSDLSLVERKILDIIEDRNKADDSVKWMEYMDDVFNRSLAVT